MYAKTIWSVLHVFQNNVISFWHFKAAACSFHIFGYNAKINRLFGGTSSQTSSRRALIFLYCKTHWNSAHYYTCNFLYIVSIIEQHWVQHIPKWRTAVTALQNGSAAKFSTVMLLLVTKGLHLSAPPAARNSFWVKSSLVGTSRKHLAGKWGEVSW